MTDQFDPTMRSHDPSSGLDENASEADYTLQDDNRTSMSRTNMDELVAPHDQPAEGGRAQVDEIDGAETNADDAFERR
jgi:hypothetical protein